MTVDIRAELISIHTLRVEGDLIAILKLIEKNKISIHTLRVEGDLPLPAVTSAEHRFQSTPSEWRVTINNDSKFEPTGDFNPHPPSGG